MQRKGTCVLDDTLRYLYRPCGIVDLNSWLSKSKHNSKIWRANTIEEAIALRATLEQEDRIDRELVIEVYRSCLECARTSEPRLIAVALA